MRKLSFVVALSLVLVLAFAGMSMAAQAVAVKNSVYSPADSAVTYQATPKVFNPDGKANYPYEIYLPNEQNPENYRIHSNYTKNTDACAACHATHTAVGNSLLQWYTVYDTCMACHDGTVTTTYDVQHGVIGTSGKAAFGGMFGTSGDASLSNHNVTGAMEIAAAPGGSVVGEDVEIGHGTEQRWTAEFGCQSCHTPHGQGGNARILHPDANLTASAAAKKIGNKYYVSPVSGYVYADAAFATAPVYILKGYPYSPAVKVDGTTSYTLKLDNSTGLTYVYGAGANTTIENGVASLKVKMAITDYLQSTETVEHKDGMNYFCGACHTDYNTAAFTANGSAEMETGVYSKAHRHQVGFDAPYFKIDVANMVKENGKMECLTCHVAHGTSTDYWTRTVGSTSTTAGRLTAAYITNDADLAELSGSSALKRLPNMGTCEACHGKGAGNEGYSANTNQADVAGTVTVANTFNFNSLNVFNYTGNANAKVGGVYPYAAFVNGDGTGFFANEKYVGSAKCESCHKEYYEGWAAEGHSKSLLTAAEFGFAAKIAAAAGSHTINLAAPVTVNNVGGTAGTKLSGTPTVVNSFSFQITADGKIIYDAYKKEADNTYTWNGQVKYDLNGAKYVWMEHYTLFDIGTTGITSEIANAVTGANVAAKANSYARVIAFEGDEIEPYIANGGVMPSFPSVASWYADGATLAGKGEGCLSCHAPKLEEAQGTADVTIGCESCHGPAGRHVVAPSTTNIFAPKTAKASQAQQVNLCATCHSGKHNQIVMADNAATVGVVEGFANTKHFTTAGMTCTTCHDVHNTVKGDGKHSSLKVSQTNKDQLCASCHDSVINVDTYFAPDAKAAHSFLKPIK